MPFPKGHKFGNRFDSEHQPDGNGRKAGSKNRATIAKKWLDLETEWTNPITGLKETISLEDQITLAQIKEARDGDHNKAINYKVLMDSRHGAPKQEIEHSGEIEMQFDIGNLSNEDLATLLAITAKAKQDAGTE
jgi:hypothetical protein